MHICSLFCAYSYCKHQIVGGLNVHTDTYVYVLKCHWPFYGDFSQTMHISPRKSDRYAAHDTNMAIITLMYHSHIALKSVRGGEKMLRTILLDGDYKYWVEWSSGTHNNHWRAISFISLKIRLKIFVLEISSSHLETIFEDTLYFFSSQLLVMWSLLCLNTKDAF